MSRTTARKLAREVLVYPAVMVINKFRLARSRRRVAAFSLVEIMVAASILGIGLASIVAVNTQVVGTLRRSTSASFASQLIQERMEQFRRASWTEITSNYPPDATDPASDGYDTDPDGDPYIEETYPTEFPYSAAELDASFPGMLEVLAISTASAAQLKDAVETVRVETYNASNTTLTGLFDWDGSPLEIGPFGVGGRPIIVERKNGVATTISHNAVVVLSTTVRLTLTVTWTGTDNVQRKKETVTLFTVEGDK